MHMVLLLCISTCIAAERLQSQTTDGDHYGIILDGGSSGTKLKIYRWRWRLTGSSKVRRYILDHSIRRRSIARDGTKFEMDLIFDKKYRPGVSALAQTLDQVKPYLEEIIRKAVLEVPFEHHRRTVICFLATAGLRVLPERETRALLSTIRLHLSNTSLNPFLVQTDGVRVISGEEEAVYAWVATNFLRGYFLSDRPPSQTVGVLEMGGGSTQIAFLPEHSVYANMFPVRMSGRTYNLYAHSYLFYGQNYIVWRINEYLSALRGSHTEIANPCMLKGDNKTHMSLGQSVQVSGTADVAKCLQILDIFLKTADDHWCYPKPCAIGRTYQPPVGDTVFFAISAFQYAPAHLESVDSQGRLNVTLLRSRAAAHCNLTLAEVVASGLKAHYGSEYCIMGLYIHSLLVDAYRFNETRNIVYMMDEINGVQIDWALGAMLLSVEDQEPAPPRDSAICGTAAGSGSPRSVIGLIISYIVTILLIYEHTY